MKRRVLIIDPVPVFRMGIAALFAQDPAFAVVGEASTAAEGIVLVRRQRPDLVLLGVCGSTLSEERADVAMLAMGSPPYKVVLLVPRVSAARARRLPDGAAGCLTKRLAPASLLGACRQILAGAGASPLSADAPAARAPGRHLSALTPRERAVLDLVAQGLANREVAKQLGISPETAKVHVKNILRKLGFTSRVAAAVWMHAHIKKRSRSHGGTRPSRTVH